MADLVLLATLVVVTVYLVLLVQKVHGGYSGTQKTPEYLVRLQVVDGSGSDGLAQAVTARITEIGSPQLAVQVVETVAFDIRPVPRSFVIARNEDTDAARALAEEVGLEPDEVVFKPLENNFRHITATLVLGRDAEERFLAGGIIREN